MKQISILGCGWLGLPLAQQLIRQGYEIKGTTTSEAKLVVLENNGIRPFLINVSGEGIEGDVTSFLKNAEILIINIPPKLRGDVKENFVAKVQNIMAAVEASTIKKVLFVSSTSVYPDCNETITEVTIPEPDSESGLQLFQAEQLLQNNHHFQTTVVRFGGLIGNDRHPIRFLAGRKNIENPDAPINLIHQDDCIGIIQKIIESDFWNETFNAVAPFHPTRKAYYTQKAIDLNLDIPEFNANKRCIGKTILSDKVISVLGYTFTKNKL
ncbi:SDR family oxidoreductase [Flavobacterium sp.]|uniref:SDR family oxidoreductase n=1 Tax=Flavobacterium sp. TaxID=239 RepID=UPI00286B636A|nr:SDR family oxidoreductase [Flavobacterium sp.]